MRIFEGEVNMQTTAANDQLIRDECRQVYPDMGCRIQSQKWGELGFLVIDRTISGSAIGGIRMAADISEAEVTFLARSMTLKCAFLNLPLGGAKAGIRLPEDATKAQRSEILQAFGRKIAPLISAEIYLPGEDLGMTPRDLRLVRDAAGLQVGGSAIDGAFYTSATIIQAVLAALEFQQRSISNVRVIIEGFGRVGSNTGRRLHRAGASILGVSTIAGAVYSPDGLPLDEIIDLQHRYGDEFVLHLPPGLQLSHADLIAQETDILIPCARPWTIHAGVVPRLRCKLIIPGANIPVTDLAEDMLYRSGILSLPDFIANAGGVLAAHLAGSGFRRSEIELVIEREYAFRVRRLLAGMKRNDEPPRRIAERIAWRNFTDMCGEYAGGASTRSLASKIRTYGFRGSVTRGASIALRRGWMSSGFVRRLALEDARRILATNGVPGEGRTQSTHEYIRGPFTGGKER